MKYAASSIYHQIFIELDLKTSPTKLNSMDKISRFNKIFEFESKETVSQEFKQTDYTQTIFDIRYDSHIIFSSGKNFLDCTYLTNNLNSIDKIRNDELTQMLVKCFKIKKYDIFNKFYTPIKRGFTQDLEPLLDQESFNSNHLLIDISLKNSHNLLNKKKTMTSDLLKMLYSFESLPFTDEKIVQTNLFKEIYHSGQKDGYNVFSTTSPHEQIILNSYPSNGLLLMDIKTKSSINIEQLNDELYQNFDSNIIRIKPLRMKRDRIE